ncbi:hypothetical protein [Nostoc sp.]|uniref:hypothetical protein n=1 Tax=Nostoc sp. TaxID=1180 RepID=UPI002FF90466
MSPIAENLLIDLCEPYLLDLIGFLTECMKEPELNTSDIARDSQYDLTDDVIVQIASLDYFQKAEVLSAAANHAKESAQRQRER